MPANGTFSSNCTSVVAQHTRFGRNARADTDTRTHVQASEKEKQSNNSASIYKLLPDVQQQAPANC